MTQEDPSAPAIGPDDPHAFLAAVEAAAALDHDVRQRLVGLNEAHAAQAANADYRPITDEPQE